MFKKTDHWRKPNFVEEHKSPACDYVPSRADIFRIKLERSDITAFIIFWFLIDIIQMWQMSCCLVFGYDMSDEFCVLLHSPSSSSSSSSTHLSRLQLTVGSSILFTRTIRCLTPAVLANMACSRVCPPFSKPVSNSPFLAEITWGSTHLVSAMKTQGLKRWFLTVANHKTHKSQKDHMWIKGNKLP